MNATLINPLPKLLTDVATRSCTTNILPELRHDPKSTSLLSIEEIHLRAETMTPLLKEILNFRPPPHWVIND
jgi:hypothetical protein